MSLDWLVSLSFHYSGEECSEEEGDEENTCDWTTVEDSSVVAAGIARESSLQFVIFPWQV